MITRGMGNFLPIPGNGASSGSPSKRVVSPTVLTDKVAKLRRIAKEYVSGLPAGV